MVAIVKRPEASRKTDIYDYPTTLSKEEVDLLISEAEGEIEESKLDLEENDIKRIIISNCYDQHEAKSITDENDNTPQLLEWLKIIALKGHNRISLKYKKYDNSELYSLNELTKEQAETIIYEATYDKDPSVDIHVNYEDKKNASYYYLNAAFEKASDKSKYKMPETINETSVLFLKEFMAQKSSWTVEEIYDFYRQIKDKNEDVNNISKIVSYILEFNSYPENTDKFFREKKLLSGLQVINCQEQFLGYIERNYNLIKGLHENKKRAFRELADQFSSKNDIDYDMIFLDLMPSELMFFSDENSLLSKAEKVSLKILRNLTQILEKLSYEDFIKTMKSYSPDMGDMIFKCGDSERSIIFLDNYTKLFMASGYENIEIECYQPTNNNVKTLKSNLFYTEETMLKNKGIEFKKITVKLSTLREAFKKLKSENNGNHKDLTLSLNAEKEIEKLVVNPNLLKTQVFLSKAESEKYQKEVKLIDRNDDTFKTYMSLNFKIPKFISKKIFAELSQIMTETEYRKIKSILFENESLNNMSITLKEKFMDNNSFKKALEGLKKYLDFISLLDKMDGKLDNSKKKEIKAKLPFLSKKDLDDEAYKTHIEKLGLEDTPKDIQKEAMLGIGNLILMLKPLESFWRVDIYKRIVTKIRSIAEDQLKKEVIPYIPDEIANLFVENYLDLINSCNEKELIYNCVNISYLKNLVLNVKRNFEKIPLQELFLGDDLETNIKNGQDICFLSQYVDCNNYQTISATNLLKLSRLYRNSNQEIQSKIEEYLKIYDRCSLAKQKIEFLAQAENSEKIDFKEIDDFCEMMKNDTVYDFFKKAEDQKDFIDKLIKSKKIKDLIKDPSKKEDLLLYLATDCDDVKFDEIIKNKGSNIFEYYYLLTSADDAKRFKKLINKEEEIPSKTWGNKSVDVKKPEELNISFLPEDKKFAEKKLESLQVEYKKIVSIDKKEKNSDDLSSSFKDKKNKDLCENIAILMELAKKDLGKELTHYQIKAILSDTNFHMPTGAGKTLTMVIKSLLEWKTGRNVIIEVPNQTLLNQVFQDYGGFLNKFDLGFTIDSNIELEDKPKIVLATYSDSYKILQNSSKKVKVTRIVDEYDYAAQGKESAAKSIDINGYHTQIQRKKLLRYGLRKDDNYQKIYEKSKEEAESLVINRDYFIVNRKIIPIVDGRKKPGFIFANFTHGFLELRHDLDISEFSISYWTSNYSSFADNSNIKLIGCSATYNAADKTPSINFSRIDENKKLSEYKSKKFDKNIILDTEATIIFCQDHEEALKYYQMFQKNNCNIKTPVIAKKDGKDCKNDQDIYNIAGEKGKITILTLSDARGLDIKVAKECVLHVIDLTGSDNASEIKQIKGRTARFGKEGKYTKISSITSKKSSFVKDALDKEAQNKQRYLHDELKSKNDELKQLKKTKDELDEQLEKTKDELEIKKDGLKQLESKNELKHIEIQPEDKLEIKSTNTNVLGKIKKFIKKVRKIKTEGNIASAEEKIANVKEKIASAEAKIASADEKIASVKEKIKTIKKDLLNDKPEITELEKFKYSLGHKEFKELSTLNFNDLKNEIKQEETSDYIKNLSKYIILNFNFDHNIPVEVKPSLYEKEMEINIVDDQQKELIIGYENDKITLNIKKDSHVFYALLNRQKHIKQQYKEQQDIEYLWGKDYKNHEELFKDTSKRYLIKITIILSFFISIIGVPLGINLDIFLLSYITASVSCLTFISALCINYSISQIENCIDLKSMAPDLKKEKTSNSIMEGFDGNIIIRSMTNNNS